MLSPDHQRLLAEGFTLFPARAKINWTLDVAGARADGYHDLDSLVQPLTLFDSVYLRPAPSLSLRVEGRYAPAVVPGESLVLRAARALREAGHVTGGADIVLHADIPTGAGLGGGSADAAATLRGLNDVWGLGLGLDALCDIGARLGADVPVCLHNAPRRMRGIGEILSPIPCKRTFPLVLVRPCGALSTKDIFAAYHPNGAPRPDTEAAIRALAAGDLSALARSAANVLESVSAALRPEIPQARQALLDAGAGMAAMTGSGSVVFGAFDRPETARAAYHAFSRRYPICILTETAL